MSQLWVLPWAWVGLILVSAWALRPQPARALPGTVAARASAGRRLAPIPTMVVLACLVVDRRLGIAVAIFWWIRWAAVRRRRRLDEAAALVRTLPEVVDLLALGLGSGGSIPMAIRLVGRRPLGALAEAFTLATDDLEGGHLLAEALERRLAPLGEPVRPLLRALVGADHYGSELQPTLVRLGDEARAARRRQSQAAAQRVPVRMLLPLVVTVLPAFILLTVAPTLARTFQNLGLSG